MFSLQVTHRSGLEGAETTGQVVTYTQSAVSTVGAAASAAVETGITLGISTAVLGGVALAAGYVGVAIAVVYVAYSLIMGNQAKVRLHQAIRASHREMKRDIGVDLVKQVYGMAIPGWSIAGGSELVGPISVGEYFLLGTLFYDWSQMKHTDKKYEEYRRKTALFLRGKGLDPARFLGYPNVKKNEQLMIMEMGVALPERILVSREALIFMGYDSSVILNLKNDFHIRMFDMIKAMGRVKTEEQAVAVKRDIENWLMFWDLDPKIFFKKSAEVVGIPSIPAPINSTISYSKEPLLLPGELEIREKLDRESDLLPVIIIGASVGAIFMFSGKKGRT